MTTLSRNRSKSVMSPSVGRQGKSAAQPVYFTPEQIRWLEDTFPEPEIGPDTSEASIRDVGGIRRLIKAMRARVRNVTMVQL